jgi:hypothetical protein
MKTTKLDSIYNDEDITKRELLEYKDFDGNNIHDGSRLRFPFMEQPNDIFYVVRLDDKYALEQIQFRNMGKHVIQPIEMCQELEVEFL